ncbi:MAG: polysaccharide biosynthesis tyrosine autokinase [Microthrixaceae bacterium]
MDLRQYLRALQKFWWVVTIPLVVGLVFGVVSVKREVPTYRSSVTFFVRTLGDVNSNFAADQFAQRRVSSYVALLSTDRLAEGIIKRAKLDMTPQQVESMIGASGDIDTVLLTATVTSESSKLASTVAKALSIEFVTMVGQVENVGTGPASVNLDLVSGPTLSQVPTRPSLTVGLYGILGLLLGLGMALIADMRDKSLHTDEEVLELGAGPILAHIPFDSTAETAPLTISDGSKVLQAEAFRKLRTNLQFINVGHDIRVVVVTSSVTGEGKSSTCANLGLAMAATGRRVLVIEADLRRPMLSEYFGLERSAGLSHVIAGRAEADDVVQPWGRSGLFVLPSGQIPPNPSELLGNELMGKLLVKFRGEYDSIIIDTPPLLPVTDGAVVSAWADGAVLVARHGRTTQRQLLTSVRTLQTVGTNILGTVLTMVPTSWASGYQTYDYSPHAVDGPAAPRQSR